MLSTTISVPTEPVKAAEVELMYARLGFQVLPVHSFSAGRCTCNNADCNSPAKHPWLPDGVLGASSNETTVRDRRVERASANVGIRTGRESNLLVIDVDGPEGLADFDALRTQLGALPESPTCRTGGGGLHLYFAYPQDDLVGNPVRVGGKCIDIRGTNGYVVAPPSVHATGASYSWLVSPELTPPPDLPIAWIDWIRREAGGGSHGPLFASTDLATAPGVGEGSRHATATRLIGIALRKGRDPIDVKADAIEWASRCDPPLPEDEACRIVADLARKDADREAGLADSVASEGGWDLPAGFDEVELPAFPTDVFPDSVGDHVRELAFATQTPADLPAMLTLAVLATVAAKRFEVRINPGYAEPLNLHVAVALGPGNRKSAVFAQVCAPLMEYEEAQSLPFKREFAVANQRREAEEARLKALNGRLAKAREGPEREALGRQAEELATRLAEMESPSPPRLIADNATPERLTSLISENGGRIAVLSAEGELFEQVAGRYSGRANLDVILKGHAGDDIRVDRMGRPPELIVAPALTIGLAIQPQVIADLMDRPGFRGKGLIARILFSMPKSLVGRRVVDPVPVREEVLARYRRTIAALLAGDPCATRSVALPQGMGTASTDRLREAARVRTLAIRLAPEAREAILTFERWLEPRLGPTRELGPIADWASKLVGAVLRIAGLLHLADRAGEPAPQDIPLPAGTMDRAIRVGQYLLPHARAAFGLMGADEVLNDARDVLGWLIDNGHVGGIVSRRDISEGTKRHDRGVERLKLAIEDLVDRRYLCELPPLPQSGAGRKPGPRYGVNPRTPIPPRPVPGSARVAGPDDVIDDLIEEMIV